MKDRPHREQIELRRQRCVDGELASGSLCDYLASLPDDSPEWRELALAFVESQQLSLAFRTDPATCVEPITVRQPQMAAASRRQEPRLRRVLPGIPVATAVLCALVLGCYVGTQFRSPHNAGGMVGPTAERQRQQRFDAPGQNLPQSDRAPTPQAAAEQNSPILEVVMESRDKLLTIPVLPHSQANFTQHQSDNDPLPLNFVNQLQENGYELMRQHELITLPLDDGRQIAVPVETIEFHHTGL